MKNIILLLSLCLSPNLWADDKLADVYGLREEQALKKLINDNKGKTDKQQGIAWHNMAVLEKSGAADKAFDILNALRKKHPKDYEILAYFGSAQTMVARDSWNFFTKTSNVNKGVALLDKAVAKDKDNPVIRLVRINNTLALPEFLNRIGKVKTDLNYLLKLFERIEARAVVQSETYYLMGQELRKNKKAKEAQGYLQQAVDVDPEGEWAKKAKAALNG